jgi:hypothetical protein
MADNNIWKVEILYNPETNDFKTNYTPDSEAIFCWMLDRAKHTVFTQPQPKRAATALSGITGWGKLTVEHKGERKS